MKNFVNLALFQIGWLISVFGGASGRNSPALAVAVVFWIVHLRYVADRRGAEMARILVISFLGLLIDSSLGLAGVIQYEARVVSWLCPPWIVVLWMLFASTFPFSLAWLIRRPMWAVLFGALGGPMSYVASARIGAVQLGQPLAPTLLVIGVTWGAIMAFLPRLTEQAIEKASGPSAGAG